MVVDSEANTIASCLTHHECPNHVEKNDRTIQEERQSMIFPKLTAKKLRYIIAFPLLTLSILGFQAISSQPISAQSVGFKQCGDPLIRTRNFSRRIYQATLKPVPQGFALQIVEEDGSYTFSLTRNLEYQTARYINLDLRVRDYGSPLEEIVNFTHRVDLKQDGSFILTLPIGTKSGCRLSGKLSFVGGSKEKLFPNRQQQQARDSTTRRFEIFSNRKFSIRYPVNWIVYDQSRDYLILYNQRPPQRGGGVAPPFVIKTDVAFLPGGFENYASPKSHNSDIRRNPDIQIVRTQRLTINGRQAIREWINGGDAFSNSIITYIQYSNEETAIVISYYNSPNRKSAEPIIQEIHASFKIP